MVVDAHIMTDSDLGPRPIVPRGAPRYVSWGAILVVLVVRLLFIVTYPLNDFGGDTQNYATMLLHGQSSLVHAGGYPFLMGLPFRVDAVQPLVSGALPYTILAIQHAIDALVLLFLYRVTSGLYGSAAGVLTLLLAGLNIQALSATSATYPEWLQADLLVLALGSTYYAFVRGAFRQKLWLYSIATFAFSWCMLVKFNVAVLGFFLVVAIAADSLALKRKIAVGCACALVCVATFGPYLQFYQYRTTGTYALTYDAAWVLLTRLQSIFSNTLDPKDGLNTRRWLALSAVLPRSYEFAGPGLFSHVDAVPDSVRASYRARFGFLVTADDYQTGLMLAQTRLPDGFSVGLSPIPIAYYIGLPESDHLGVRVAMEAIRAHPATYLKGVWHDVEHAISNWAGDAPFAAVTNLASHGVNPVSHLPFGYVRVSQRPDYWNVPYSFSVPVLWWPGLRLFTALNRHGLPAYWPSLAVGLAFLLTVVRVSLVRRIDLQSGTTFLLTAMVYVMIVVSVATLAFRWKEARVLLPLVSVLAGAAFSAVLSVASVARHVRASHRSRQVAETQ
jgi:hypothetical protein